MKEKHTSRCRKCDAEIAWVKTKSGKNMPVDIETWDGEIEYDSKKHISHFSTCPNAEEFRNGKKADVSGIALTKSERDARGLK